MDCPGRRVLPAPGAGRTESRPRDDELKLVYQCASSGRHLAAVTGAFGTDGREGGGPILQEKKYRLFWVTQLESRHS